MKYEQIASILNEVFDVNAEESKASANLSSDLSNCVDFGRTIVSGTTTLDSQFLTLANVIDKIRKTIYIDAEFVGSAPQCFVDDSEMNGLKEVMRVSVGDVGSGVYNNAKELFAMYGMDIDKDIVLN